MPNEIQDFRDRADDILNQDVLILEHAADLIDKIQAKLPRDNSENDELSDDSSNEERPTEEQEQLTQLGSKIFEAIYSKIKESANNDNIISSNNGVVNNAIQNIALTLNNSNLSETAAIVKSRQTIGRLGDYYDRKADNDPKKMDKDLQDQMGLLFETMNHQQFSAIVKVLREEVATSNISTNHMTTFSSPQENISGAPYQEEETSNNRSFN